MAEQLLTQDQVLEHSRALTAFPSIITEILSTLDDPEANLKALVDHIKHDPLIAARVLSRANVASTHTQSHSAIRDIYTATSLIGMRSVREMVLIGSVVGFMGQIAPAGLPASFWQHSVAAGVCCEELSHSAPVAVSPTAALIAGLMHDIGQVWLYRFNAEAFRAAWLAALDKAIGIEQAEREFFGADHALIGSWLAERWSLPDSIVLAIRHHHAPDKALNEPLVPLVHVAEVLSNALDLTGREENRVTALSLLACRQLGLTWDSEAHSLFGRMEARSRHATSTFA